ncbi:hypothetical protein JR316_0012780 [Psilocybe cubensis]|uniref:Uncharacterized protein n=2 Tax=Psilocybe cubensis TaxID=181762 RepID=A0ACB8GG91_PSICU|nr:hypothetical protein JR316_0012780 [Psilocybe cubensis]KAH9474322.1 hypothetical protein JR316_0012780 [Psilocybe cubensis]
MSAGQQAPGERFSVILCKVDSIEDVDNVIALYHRELEEFPPQHPNKCHLIGSFADALTTRFQYTGAKSDIDNAITRYQEALDLFSPNQTGRDTAAFSLGLALNLRYEKFFTTNDIGDSISNSRESLRLRPLGHRGRPKSLHQLMYAYMRRYEHQGSVDDLEEAISFGRESLDLLGRDPEDHSSTWSRFFTNLISDIGQQESTTDNYGKVLSRTREVILVGDNDPLRLSIISNLGAALTWRYEQGQLLHCAEPYCTRDIHSVECVRFKRIR